MILKYAKNEFADVLNYALKHNLDYATVPFVHTTLSELLAIISVLTSGKEKSHSSVIIMTVPVVSMSVL